MMGKVREAREAKGSKGGRLWRDGRLRNFNVDQIAYNRVVTWSQSQETDFGTGISIAFDRTGG